MKNFKWICLAHGLLLTPPIFALPAQDTTVTLYLLNNTNHVLLYQKSDGENPGNVFYVEPRWVLPHETTIMTGIITQDADLAGALHFIDDTGNPSTLIVLNPRAFHSTQPIFNLNGEHYRTTHISMTHYTNVGPKDLIIKTVNIQVDSINPTF